jgi:cysteine-rich repeat protein
MQLNRVGHDRFAKPVALSLFVSFQLAAAQVGISASQRIGSDGRIGSANPLAAAVGPHRGLCAKWAKENVPSRSFVTEASQAERLLDNVPPDASNPATLDLRAGDQSTPQRNGRFFARAPVLDFESFGIVGLHSPSLVVPWHGGGCRLQGTSGSPPNVTSLGDSFSGRFRGNLHIPQAGTYTVLIRSDDGYALRIGGTDVSSYRLDRPQASDSKRVVFSAAGVYPFELVYYDSGGGAVLEVFLAFADVCFSGAGTPVLENPCASGTDLVNVDLDTLPPDVFKLLDYKIVDLPTWVTSSSDPAFTAADETCSLEQADPTCGPPSNTACGNGVRERVNVGTLGTPMFSDEQCDDGNLTNGDGCTSTCTVETDFLCAQGPISSCSLPRPMVVSPAQGQNITTGRPTYSGKVSGLNADTGYSVDLSVDGALLAGCGDLPLTQGAFSCNQPAPSLKPGAHTVFAILKKGTSNPTPGEATAFTVTLNPPDTTIESGPSGIVSSSNATFTFSANQSPVTFQCKVDTAVVFSSCVSPLLLSGLTPGVHALEVRAVNVDGLTDTTPAVGNWTVALPPNAPIISLPVSGTSTNKVQPEFSGTAPASTTVNIYLDNATAPSCTTTSSAGGTFRCVVSRALSEGSHFAIAKSVNGLGIESAPSSPNAFTIDTVAPAVSLVSPLGTISDVRPRLTGTCEPGALLRVYFDDIVQPICAVSGGANGTFECVPPDAISSGPHRFTAEAEDAAGNVSARPPPLEFIVSDSTARQRSTTITQPSEGARTGRRPLFAGTAEPKSTVRVTIDGAKVCEALVDTSGNWSCPLTVYLSKGPHTATAQALLSAASSSSEAFVGFTVDTGKAQTYGVGCGCENGSERLLGLFSVLALIAFRYRR